MTSAYIILGMGEPLGKTSLGSTKRWEDNIRMYLREIGFGDQRWIELAQNHAPW
jgi:hypothetical protein